MSVLVVVTVRVAFAVVVIMLLVVMTVVVMILRLVVVGFHEKGPTLHSRHGRDRTVALKPAIKHGQEDKFQER